MTAWERLANVTLGSTGSTLSSGTITAKNHLRVIIHTLNGGGSTKQNIQFNGDTSGNYARRRSNNGATDSTDTGQTQLEVYGDTAEDNYTYMDIINVGNKAKIVQADYVINTNGAGNAPNSSEWVGRWNNTSDQITSIVCHTTSYGTGYASGSSMTVFGADDAPAATPFYPNLPNGAIFEESDTGKHQMFDGSQTWNEM